MGWWETLAGLAKNAMGIGAKVAPKAQVVIHPLGAAATISFSTMEAGLAAAMQINWAGINAELQRGQFVTGGLMAMDAALEIVAPFLPEAAAAEQVVHMLAALGQLSLAHNAGEGGIGPSPEGSGSVGLG